MIYILIVARWRMRETMCVRWRHTQSQSIRFVYLCNLWICTIMLQNLIRMWIACTEVFICVVHALRKSIFRKTSWQSWFLQVWSLTQRWDLSKNCLKMFFGIYFPSGWKVCGESRFHHNPWMQVGFFIFSELKTLAGGQLDLCVLVTWEFVWCKLKRMRTPNNCNWIRHMMPSD